MSSRTDPPSERSSIPVAPASQASAATRSAAAASRSATSKRALLAAALLLLSFTPGCYLAHLAGGQLRLIRAERPIEAVVADPATPETVRSSLRTIQDARAFAGELGLDVDGQYEDYVDWPGDRIVTIVTATRPGELTPAGFWFPLLGTLPYKGYFDPARADAEALAQQQQGRDACVAPVPAYSTLGWLDDPITAPMLARGEGWAVETVLHELVHATVYLRDHAEFNETVASFIGQEASIRFYASRPDRDAAERRRAEVAEQRALTATLIAFRENVADLYAREPAGKDRDRERRALEAAARAEMAAIPMQSRDAEEIAQALALNDACLALIATYGAELHRFEAALDDLDGDLVAFVARVRLAEDADDPIAAVLGPIDAAP